MSNVTFKCGHCGKLMGVNPQNLGKQVRCPHCQKVVLAPAAAPAATVPPVPVVPPIPTPSATPPPAPASPAPVGSDNPEPKKSVIDDDQESIFGEVVDDEDLFGRPTAKPKLELPPGLGLEPAFTHVPPTMTGPAGVPYSAAGAPTMIERDGAAPAPGPTMPAARASSERATLALAYAFIILVPFAIFLTGVTIYLWIVLQSRHHPYDDLPETPTGSVPAVRQLAERDGCLHTTDFTDNTDKIRVCGSIAAGVGLAFPPGDDDHGRRDQLRASGRESARSAHD